MSTTRARTRSARPIRLLAALAVAVVVGSALAACGPSPSPTPPPSAPPVAVADRAPLAPDGQIDEAGIAHDSRDDLYRTPFGAVPAGTEVLLRLRATAGDLTDATVRVWDELAGIQALIPMEVIASDRTAGEHGIDYWQATIRTSAQPTILWYRFIVRDGPTTRYLEDDPPDDGAAVPEGADGGTGRVYEESIDASWQIVVHEPSFETPAWAHGAVVYQVFPDRFYDGDPANNPTPDAEQGTEGAARFRYGDVYGNPILVKTWDELPEGHCRAYQGVPCDEGPLGRDFFGGDLAGVTAKLDDLAALGVTVIYFNPIFAAPSNHRYDTSSYDVVDPDLGTEADLERLIAEAEARGIRVLLDGVFNHVSSDSPWFDRERRFEETGACETADSAYRSWFTFRAPKPNEPSPCAASDAGGDDTYYVGWFGFDTIPEVVEQGAVFDLFTGPDGVVGRWVKAGTAGWRLDVMDNMSHGFLRKIREATKAADPEALVLGEQWLDSSAWLLGDQADTTMNYRFRRAVIGLVNGATADLDGAISGLSPSQFAARMESVMEDYPKPAFDALLNLVDSHDTTRILWTLAPGKDDPAVKESAGGPRRGQVEAPPGVRPPAHVARHGLDLLRHGSRPHRPRRPRRPPALPLGRDRHGAPRLVPDPRPAAGRARVAPDRGPAVPGGRRRGGDPGLPAPHGRGGGRRRPQPRHRGAHGRAGAGRGAAARHGAGGRARRRLGHGRRRSGLDHPAGPRRRGAADGGGDRPARPRSARGPRRVRGRRARRADLAGGRRTRPRTTSSARSCRAEATRSSARPRRRRSPTRRSAPAPATTTSSSRGTPPGTPRRVPRSRPPCPSSRSRTLVSRSRPR